MWVGFAEIAREKKEFEWSHHATNDHGHDDRDYAGREHSTRDELVVCENCRYSSQYEANAHKKKHGWPMPLCETNFPRRGTCGLHHGFS
jgi:hypothetical protein